MEAAFSWDEPRIATLKSMSAGGYRASVIAARLGTSRNAVLGKLHRLGISSPVPPKAKPYVRKPRAPGVKIVRRVTHSSGILRAVPTVELERLRTTKIECLVPLADVTGCRYPEGDGPFLFCDGPQHPGSSYCLSHFLLCRREPKPLHDAVMRRNAA